MQAVADGRLIDASWMGGEEITGIVVTPPPEEVPSFRFKFLPLPLFNVAQSPTSVHLSSQNSSSG